MEKKNTLSLGSAIIMLIVAIGVFAVSNVSCGSLFSNKAIDAVEKYVAQQVYISLGVTCERYDSNVIYKSGDKQLISVRFYTKGSSYAVGSYCVYCEGEYVMNSTKMM